MGKIGVPQDPERDGQASVANEADERIESLAVALFRPFDEVSWQICLGVSLARRHGRLGECSRGRSVQSL
jgi:hypothetical protein